MGQEQTSGPPRQSTVLDTDSSERDRTVRELPSDQTTAQTNAGIKGASQMILGRPVYCAHANKSRVPPSTTGKGSCSPIPETPEGSIDLETGKEKNPNNTLRSLRQG